LIGHYHSKSWGRIVFAAAMGITIYWPVVCLSALVDVRDAAGWNISHELDIWIVLPIILLWGIWGLCVVARDLK